MLVLSKYLQTSNISKVTYQVTNSGLVTLGSLGVCYYRLRWRKGYNEIIQTCIIGKINPDRSIIVYPVVSLEGDKAVVALSGTKLYPKGMIWSDNKGRYQFMLTKDPVKRTVIEDGTILELDGTPTEIQVN